MGRKRIGVQKSSASSVAISFTYQGARCRERIRCKPTDANLKKITRHREIILDAIERGTFDYASTFPNSKNKYKFKQTSSTTVKTFFNSWHEKHAKTLKSSSAYTNGVIVARLIKDFGPLPISEFDWTIIKEWLEARDITTKTIRNYLSVICPALDEAKSKGLILFNPVLGEKLKGKPSTKKEKIDPFSHAERNQILNACSGQDHNLIKFAFWTGMRPSELIALKWSSIDWETKKIRVHEARTRYAQESEAPKTAAGYRNVKLLPEAINSLNDQKNHTYLEGNEIFQNPITKARWSSDKIYRDHWISILKKAGVRYRYPYQARHSFATMMLMKKENLNWVSEQLGHSSPVQTLSAYARWIEEDDPNAGMKAAAAYKYTPESTKKIRAF